MRTMFCLMLLVGAACAQPDAHEVEAAPNYCVGPAEPRSEYLTANYQRLARDVVARDTVVLNQRDAQTIRVARTAGRGGCAPPDEGLTLEEVQSSLEEALETWPRAAPRCSITIALKGEVTAYVGDRNLLQPLSLVGLRTEAVLFSGDENGTEAEVNVREECAFAEPIIRAVVAQVDGPAR